MTMERKARMLSSSPGAVARGGTDNITDSATDNWLVFHGGGRLGASGLGWGGDNGWPGPGDADGLGARDARERSGLGECGRGRLLHRGGGGIVGNFANHIHTVDAEVDAGGISHGDVKGAQDELGAAEVDGVADQGVDDFHERGLDAFLVLD